MGVSIKQNCQFLSLPLGGEGVTTVTDEGLFFQIYEFRPFGLVFSIILALHI